MLLRTLKAILRWMVGLFLGSTILAVVAFRFLPVYVTPLMLIRCYEQVSEGRDLKLSHDWVPLRQMSPHMPTAVMGSEDVRFLQHHGFDFEAIQKASEHNRKHKDRPKHGASTITQQTAKNVFLWPSRSWVRKGLEAYFTLLIELCWSKERIMEVYLNSIEMGDGVYGLEAVAQEVFHTSASELTRQQCALVAATLPNPRLYSSAHPSSYVLARRDRILREMKFVTPLNTEK